VAAAFNFANVFFGLGAFLTPLAVAFLIRSRSLAFTLFLIAGLAVLPGLLALTPSYPAREEAEEGIGFLLGQPRLWLCAMTLFFYGPLEASIGGWATSYLVEQGVKEESASAWLSSFWLAYMAARLLTFFILPAGLETLLILILGVLGVVLLACLVACRNRYLATALIPAAGLIFGPIFPTLFGVLLGPWFPTHVHGRAVGLFFAIGGIGWTLIPILIGAYAKRTSIQRGFVIALGAALGLGILAVVLYLNY